MAASFQRSNSVMGTSSMMEAKGMSEGLFWPIGCCRMSLVMVTSALAGMGREVESQLLMVLTSELSCSASQVRVFPIVFNHVFTSCLFMVTR